MPAEDKHDARMSAKDEIGSQMEEIIGLVTQLAAIHRDIVDQLHDFSLAAAHIARGLDHIASAIEAARPGGNLANG
jgi:hypothetical protein